MASSTFKPGDMVRYIGREDTMLTRGVVVTCPDRLAHYSWARRDDHIWVLWEGETAVLWEAPEELALRNGLLDI